MAGPSTLIFILLALVAIPLVIVGVIYLIVPGVKGLIWLVKHLATFVFQMIGDTLRFIGAIVTSLLFMLLTVANLVIGRWSASGHYGRAVQGEFTNMGRCLYRLAVGHPLRLLCLSSLTEGIEQRVPEVMAAAPGADRPSRRAGTFEGYAIVGSLPGGGSGARLYIAEPDARKREIFNRSGATGVERVVIKSFSLNDGSTLPQIVRESRALPAARKLGLILEHELTDERFFYVTRYVPGESLGLITQRMHAASGPEGLDAGKLQSVISFAGDLLDTLANYHAGGLWHKDVKPDNVIICDGRAHLVDFGLVTPLRSSMTLTTHGTEYFRDPELVRMALRGVKVHEVDGAKFDVYAVGAVLYSMIENSFPAHGGLSQISRRCPDSLRWVVRRAMTDYDKRYISAREMLEDLRVVANARDPFAVRPIELPSVRAGGPAPASHSADPGIEGHAASFGAVAAAAPRSPVGGAAGQGPGPFQAAPYQLGPGPYQWGSPSDPDRPFEVGSGNQARRAGVVRVTDWWTGRYSFTDAAGQRGNAAAARADGPGLYAGMRPGGVAAGSPAPRAEAVRTPSSAAEQLVRARERASGARKRAQERMAAHRSARGNPRDINAGVILATLVVIGLIAAPLALVYSSSEVELPESRPAFSIRIDGEGDTDVAARLSSGESPVEHASGASIVVLRDPVSIHAHGSNEAIDGGLESLLKHGFLLVGDVQMPVATQSKSEPLATGVIQTDDLLKSDAERVASIRAAVGLEPFGSDGARTRLISWLDQEGTDTSMILWIGRADSGDEEFWLVSSRNADPGLIALASDALVEAAHANR